MKIKMKLIRLFLLFGLLTVPFSTVSAQGPDNGDIVLFGQNYTLESGETLNNAIGVFGGNVTIEKDAIVNGDIIIFGGNLEIEGEVNGDIALIGGNVTISGETKGDVVLVGGQAELTKTARINGNVAMVGGNIDKEEGAEITGTVTNNAPPTFDTPDVPNVPDIPNVPDVPAVPNIPNGPNFDIEFNPFWEIGSTVVQSLVIAAIGMLLMLFLQPQLQRAGDAMSSQPFIAGGFGLLTVIVLPIAIVIMAVTILLIPIALILAFVIPLAWLFGMVALGQEVGDRFTKAINQTWAPVLSTGFGTFILVLVTGLVSLVPCIGWVASFLVYLVAFGGVAMTWFGTRNASRTNTAIVPPPPSA